MRLDIYPSGTRLHCSSLAPRAIAVLLATMTVTLALPGAARAQSPDELVTVSAALANGPREKSPETALALAAIGTGASWAALFYGASLDSGALMGVGFAGVLVAPSLGHFYAGETGTGVLHTGLRAGGAAATGIGLAWMFADTLSVIAGGDSDVNSSAPLIIAGGALLSIGASIYSIYDAPRAVRRRNRKQARELVLTPAPMVGPERSTGFGLQLSRSF